MAKKFEEIGPDTQSAKNASVESIENQDSQNDENQVPLTSNLADSKPDSDLNHETKEDTQNPPKKHNKIDIKHWAHVYWAKKKWSVPLTLVILLLLLYIVPFTRLNILGLFMKEPYSISLRDSITGTPVSGATVAVGSTKATSNGNGIAKITLPLGYKTVTITKKYYKNDSEKITVSLSKSHNNSSIKLIATGRQVPVKIVNRITGKGLAGAEIKVLDTEAKTDKLGNATLVVPASDTTLSGSINANGYNNDSIKLVVTATVDPKNTFPITPSGKIYFLSKLSGKIDVVKTNLDGTDRQTVLPGTGNESDTGTVLLASRDWKYLALLSQRTTSNAPELDFINTSNDQESTIQSGNKTITVVGWSGTNFIYQILNNDLQNNQAGKSSLHSYSAINSKDIILDQGDASGTPDNYIGESIANPYIFTNSIVYTTSWGTSFGYSGSPDLASKHADLISISPDGTNKKVIKSFSLSDTSQQTNISLVTVYPDVDTLYIDFYDNAQDNYYTYKNGQINLDSTLSQSSFFGGKTYSTYLLSPSGNATFWSESRDGKNTLIVGNATGDSPSQIATLSSYDTYGWYTDNYILVSKNSSELYIMPATGGTPLKITDYHKPNVTFNGYGGGYGGR